MSYLDDTFGAGTHHTWEEVLHFKYYEAKLVETGFYDQSRTPIFRIDWYLGDWNVGSGFITVTKEQLYFHSIEITPEHQSKPGSPVGGFVSHLVKIIPEFWGPRGVQTMKTAITEVNRPKFESTGLPTHLDAEQIVSLQDPDSPVVQYSTWKQGLAPEPEWH